MARKNTLPVFATFNNVDISVNQTSLPTDVTGLDNVGIHLSWSGTTPIGTLFVDSSQDGLTWIALDFGSSITVSGNTGTHSISINQVPFYKIRLRYVATSGTGLMTAKLSSKQVGG